MSSLAGRRISEFYRYLLHVAGGITTTPTALEDGAGNASAVQFSTYGLNLPVDVSDVSAPPTDAQLDTAFGAPATVGTGFVAVNDDAGAGTASTLVWTNGTAWFTVAGTKAL